MIDTKYKLGSIDKKQITAAARKALMAADAHYYAWPTQQQERFRTTMGENSRNKVRCVLLDSCGRIRTFMGFSPRTLNNGCMKELI